MAYKFPVKINNETFFRMSRDLVLKKCWAKLPLSSKTIYPVIAVHADKNGSAYPSQETIGIMSGCTPKTVREGIKGLLKFPSFCLDHWVTSRGKRACNYIINAAPEGKGKAVILRKAFFEGGNWSMLSKPAKALYPVVLAFSFFEFELYWSIFEEEDNSLDVLEHNEFFTEGYYEQREFDMLEAETSVLAEYAGISERAVYSSMTDLAANHFIERFDRGIWKVFRWPPIIYRFNNDSI